MFLIYGIVLSFLLKAMVLYYCVTQKRESGSFEGSLYYMLDYILTSETTIDI